MHQVFSLIRESRESFCSTYSCAFLFFSVFLTYFLFFFFFPLLICLPSSSPFTFFLFPYSYLFLSLSFSVYLLFPFFAISSISLYSSSFSSHLYLFPFFLLHLICFPSLIIHPSREYSCFILDNASFILNSVRSQLLRLPRLALLYPPFLRFPLTPTSLLASLQIYHYKNHTTYKSLCF